MPNKKALYLTTTLPYVNSAPHLGFALEIVQADAIARYKRLQGSEVFFNFGTDEHGLKIYRKAIEENKEPQQYVDEYAKKFDKLKKALNLSYNNFIRTTDGHHIKAAQEFWNRCLKNGDIYKKFYKIKYCVGCELEKTDSELENGKCPIHPNLKIEIFEEENYFFRFSKYQDKLLHLYKTFPDFVIPKHRLKEISTFVSGGLEDFSVSRLKKKMPWGIDVPNDPDHIMFVWFDALVNYISAIGWPDNKKGYEKWWPVLQFAGKDNLRQQSAIWQAMLMSAGLTPSKQIFIHGFITSAGEKMSKSLGNVIDPFEYVEKYGTDALRYYLLAKISPTGDGDFTMEKFEEVYQSDLANGLGNLVARVAGMAEKANYKSSQQNALSFSKEVAKAVESYQLDKALTFIWQKIKSADKFINERGVWNLEGEQKKAALANLVKQIFQIAYDLQPFLPDTVKKIEKQYKGPVVKPEKALFPRLK
jgi:methionyl-tRNA synthetase